MLERADGAGMQIHHWDVLDRAPGGGGARLWRKADGLIHVEIATDVTRQEAVRLAGVLLTAAGLDPDQVGPVLAQCFTQRRPRRGPA